jgi:hypothetical protein
MEPWDSNPGDAQWVVTAGGGGPASEQVAVGAPGLASRGRDGEAS